MYKANNPTPKQTKNPAKNIPIKPTISLIPDSFNRSPPTGRILNKLPSNKRITPTNANIIVVRFFRAGS